MTLKLTEHGNVDQRGRQTVLALMEDEVIASAAYWQTVGSTNAEALHDSATDVVPNLLPRLYLTDQQSSGRGRYGRSWQSSEDNLAFSIAIDWQLNSNQASEILSIAVGVAIARAIEFVCAPIRCRLKWPNDIYIDSGKVAGVLIESQPAVDRLVIGIGLNVSQSPSAADLQKADGNTSVVTARSLSEASGRSIEKYSVLEAVVTQVIEATQEIKQNADGVLSDFRSRCFLTGQQVSFVNKGQPTVGVCKGISDNGDLTVDVSGDIIQCRCGEANQVRTHT